jgi:hypothetical protein
LLSKLQPRYQEVHDQQAAAGRRASLESTFAAVEPPHDSYRFTGDWWKNNERRAAGQRAEQQRMADHYARTTKEQEDRANAEARESFMEQQRRLTVNRPLKQSPELANGAATDAEDGAIFVWERRLSAAVASPAFFTQVFGPGRTRR